MAETKRDVLRDVELQGTGYRLTVWELAGSPHMSTGQERLAYEFRNRAGEVLFAGDDFGCSPQDAIDSDDMLRGLLGFLTLRPGATDDDYFADYTDAQRAFAEGDAEELSMWALDNQEELESGPFPFVDWHAADDDDEELYFEGVNEPSTDAM